MAHPEVPRHAFWHRREAATLLGAYPTRMMLALIASVTLLVICFHLPWHSPLDAIGWQIRPETDRPLLELVDIKQESPRSLLLTAPIPTTFGTQVAEDTEQGNDKIQQEEADLPAPIPPPIEKMRGLEAVLDYAEKPPAIEGGLGAYYIHIDYPEAAIAAGIEGRLILSFVVETDGRPSQIKVMQSLHPLCDSSAVAALRMTRFIPGRQNGETVRVRMRLPVRFKLLNQRIESTEEQVDTGL